MNKKKFVIDCIENKPFVSWNAQTGEFHPWIDNTENYSLDSKLNKNLKIGE